MMSWYVHKVYGTMNKMRDKYDYTTKLSSVFLIYAWTLVPHLDQVPGTYPEILTLN
jgi:hypothetical protein